MNKKKEAAASYTMLFMSDLVGTGRSKVAGQNREMSIEWTLGSKSVFGFEWIPLYNFIVIFVVELAMGLGVIAISPLLLDSWWLSVFVFMFAAVTIGYPMVWQPVRLLVVLDHEVGYAVLFRGYLGVFRKKYNFSLPLYTAYVRCSVRNIKENKEAVFANVGNEMLLVGFKQDWGELMGLKWPFEKWV